jgi:hypothetical protein
MAKKPDDQYSPEEAQERMKAALLGARLAGHVPMKAKKAGAKKPTKKPKNKEAGKRKPAKKSKK